MQGAAQLAAFKERLSRGRSDAIPSCGAQGRAAEHQQVARLPDNAAPPAATTRPSSDPAATAPGTGDGMAGSKLTRVLRDQYAADVPKQISAGSRRRTSEPAKQPPSRDAPVELADPIGRGLASKKQRCSNMRAEALQTALSLMHRCSKHSRSVGLADSWHNAPEPRGLASLVAAERTLLDESQACKPKSKGHLDVRMQEQHSQSQGVALSCGRDSDHEAAKGPDPLTATQILEAARVSVAGLVRRQLGMKQQQNLVAQPVQVCTDDTAKKRLNGDENAIEQAPCVANLANQRAISSSVMDFLEASGDALFNGSPGVNCRQVLLGMDSFRKASATAEPSPVKSSRPAWSGRKHVSSNRPESFLDQLEHADLDSNAAAIEGCQNLNEDCSSQLGVTFSDPFDLNITIADNQYPPAAVCKLHASDENDSTEHRRNTPAGMFSCDSHSMSCDAIQLKQNRSKTSSL
eukprot:364262-Chlamydomonas_euryale.AAC.10